MNILEYETCQEKKTHGDPSFPYITYLCSIPLDFSCVPVHWHDEFEIIYIKKGKGLISVDLESTIVEAGTLALILPGQLHAIHQYEEEKMEYENIIFHSNLLYSRHSDACSSDYLQPLFSNTLAVPTFIKPDMEGYQELAACIDRADEICKSFPKAYPFAIKSQLFQFFYLLFSEHAILAHSGKNIRSLDKMKQIIKFIEQNYSRRITIAEISAELGLSQSHFMKYFKKTMGTSFVEYLNEYRLTMASRLLLVSSDSILNIAGEVGFENLSYFNRVFKKRFGITPRDYRKQL